MFVSLTKFLLTSKLQQFRATFCEFIWNHCNNIAISVGCSDWASAKLKCNNKKTLFFCFFSFHFIKLGFNWMLLFELPWELCVSIQDANGIKLARNASVTEKTNANDRNYFVITLRSQWHDTKFPLSCSYIIRWFESITLPKIPTIPFSIAWCWTYSEWVLFVSIAICVWFHEIQFMMW